jgi:hypothetical protein
MLVHLRDFNTKSRSGRDIRETFMHSLPDLATGLPESRDFTERDFGMTRVQPVFAIVWVTRSRSFHREGT